MAIKQKITKWHIVVIFILGIGGYLMSQNTWVFEKQVSIETYEQVLTQKTWERKVFKIQDTFLFHLVGSLFGGVSPVSSCEIRKYQENAVFGIENCMVFADHGTWSLDEKTLNHKIEQNFFKNNEAYTVNETILFLNSNTMILREGIKLKKYISK